MSTTKDATMAEPGDKAPHFKLVSHSKASKKAKTANAKEAAIGNHAFQFKMRITMTNASPGRQSTYNLLPKTKILMMTMAEQDPGLSITSIDGKSTTAIKSDTFLRTEMQFKQYFNCKWEKTKTAPCKKVLLRCIINSNKTLNNLKHKTQPSSLLQWLCNEKIFLEANVLGISKTKMVGYLTGIHPQAANQTSAKEKLQDTLKTVILNPNKALKLNPSLNNMINTMHNSGDDVTLTFLPLKLSNFNQNRTLQWPAFCWCTRNQVQHQQGCPD